MTEAATTRSLVIERDMPHPPEKIWRALTQGPLIEEWLMKNDFQPAVGHQFSFRSTPVPGWNGVIDSEVLVMEPNALLSYSWATMGMTSVVTWTLTPTNAGTHLRMEQTGFRSEQIPPTRARPTAGRSSSAIWSVSLEGWTEEHWTDEGPSKERGAKEVGLTMKGKNLAYWTTTVLVAFFMSGGIAQIAQFKADPHGVVPQLGYPMYFFAIIGFWKVLGAIAILVPRFPRLKEWAYAGIFFDLTGAAASCVAVGVYGVYGFHVIAPLLIAGLTVASWALRPPSRTIGVLFPATNA